MNEPRGPDGSMMEELLASCSEPWTYEEYMAEMERLTCVIAAKHGVPEAYVPTLIANHEYRHGQDGDSSEDDYLENLVIGRHMGWWLK